MSWSPPNAVHHWECPLLAFAVEAAIQDALGDRAIRAPGRHALGYGSFRLGIYAARTRCISTVGAKLQCWKGRVGETHIGVSRGPQTLWPSGQRLKSEITPLGVPQTSFHARVALLLVCQNRQYILSGLSGIFPTTSLLRPFGSIPCVASSATTWVNLPNVGRQPTRMYQLRQWACNRHLGYGRTSALQCRLKNSTCVTLVQYWEVT